MDRDISNEMSNELQLDTVAGLAASGGSATGCCKYGEADCGELYFCGRCARERRARAYRNLTEEQKSYDRYVDPAGAYHTDFPSGCSCHLSAPCSYCLSLTKEEVES